MPGTFVKEGNMNWLSPKPEQIECKLDYDLDECKKQRQSGACPADKAHCACPPLRFRIKKSEKPQARFN